MKFKTSKFIFKNFRNIGIKREEYFNIGNYSEGCGNKNGDLVIIIGANNTGKSNIIDGIFKFANNAIDINRDKTNLDFDEDRKNISIDFENSKTQIKNCNNKIDIISNDNKERLELLKKEFIEIAREKFSKEEFECMKMYIPNESLDGFLDVVQNIGYSLSINCGYFGGPYSYRYNNISINKTNLSEFSSFTSNFRKLYDSVKNKKIPFKVLKYSDQNQFSNSDLRISLDAAYIKQNNFWRNLFAKIDFNVEELQNSAQTATTQTNYGILEKQEAKINKLLENKVSKKFNKLYTFGKTNYEFKVRIESNNINLLIYENNEPITLEYQSTGFKWFFTLYFNNILETLTNGDILLLDEPGVYLHANGQIELRKFLKQLAKEKDINIILTTHSPFMIDLDYLDEIRTVTKVNGCIKINNKFSLIDIPNPDESDDPDSIDVLNEIKSALTISKNVLFKEESKVFFVEGITDYNYLTGMKQILGEEYKDLIFLPINGLGKDKKQQQLIIEKIVKLWKYEPIILTDSDGENGVGKKFKKLVEELKAGLTVLNLDDLVESFSGTIEDVFSENDRKRICFDSEGKLQKTFNASASFKKYADSLQLEEETINNFKKIFDSLMLQ